MVFGRTLSSAILDIPFIIIILLSNETLRELYLECTFIVTDKRFLREDEINYERTFVVFHLCVDCCTAVPPVV